VPRDGDPRVVVRLSPELAVALGESARSANVAVAALVRECAERFHEVVAREVASGAVRLRRARVEVAAQAAPVVPARALVDASALALERQRRLNVSADRARRGGKS
jgi:urocanate hydratase